LKGAELIERCWAQQEKHGWHTKSRTPYTYAALFHSEVSEALEEVRDGRTEGVWNNWERALGPHGETKVPDILPKVGWLPKPEGMPIELIDLVIRIGDYAGTVGWFGEKALRIDTEAAVQLFNTSVLLREGLIVSMETPAEFLEELHILIDEFAVAMRRLDTGEAKSTLAVIVEIVSLYFVYRGWDFEKLFELKWNYNERRPFRHGGKAL
jgi:hypothetical protein